MSERGWGGGGGGGERIQRLKVENELTVIS